MRNKIQINHPPAPALKRRGSNSKRLLFKEGLGWLILGCCAILFCCNAFGNINTNFWGYYYTPKYLSDPSNGYLLQNAEITDDYTQSDDTYSFSYDGITCGLGFVDSTIARHRNPQPMSVPSNDTLDYSDCNQKAQATYYLAEDGDNQKTYDSSRFMIDHCAQFNKFGNTSIGSFFGEASGALQYISNDPNRWPPFRDWLKKVLYYNMDSNYYCSDVEAILATMQYFNAQRGDDINGFLAIVKFLADSHRCPGMVNPKTWSLTRSDQYNNWRDTTRNPKLTPFDTTLPSLEDLDLQILRGPQYAAVKDAFTPSTSTKIKYFTISENPFKAETTLRFGLADAEYMRIDIYDLLGNKIYSDSKLFGAGDEEWRLDGKSMARGSLYARLSTMGGEVKTVKLVHEK